MPKPTETEINLAKELHKRICHHDTGGACSWKHVPDPWSNPAYYDNEDWPYKYYLNRAKHLLKVCSGSLEKAMAVLIAIFGS